MCIRDRRYVDPSRYPGIDVDLTFQVERGVPYADLEKLLRQEDSELLKSHRLTDVYSGEDGRDSVTLRLEFSSQEKTLAREEVQPVVDRMVAVSYTHLAAGGAPTGHHPQHLRGQTDSGPATGRCQRSGGSVV